MFRGKEVKGGRVKEYLRLLLPYLIVVVLYLLLVFGFKSFAGGRYEGTEFGGFDLVNFFVTLKTFILSSFPLYVPVSYEKHIVAVIPDYRLSFAGISEGFRVVWILKAGIAASLVAMALKTHDYKKDCRLVLLHLVTLLLLLILSVLLVSVSSKYQSWVVHSGVLAYSSSSYVAQLFAAAIVAVLFCWLSSVRFINKLPTVAVFFIGIIILSPVIVIIEFHNDHVLATQRDSANKWHAIESMNASGVLASVPSGAIIFAPEFMQTGGIASMREGYWGAYLRGKHGIDIDITADHVKYYDPMFYGRRYSINYQSKPPFVHYNACLVPSSSGHKVHIHDNETTGFYGQETDGAGNIYHWSKSASMLSLCNGSNKTENLEFSAKVRTDQLRKEPLRVCLLEKCTDYQLSQETTLVRETADIPPGCSTITLQTLATPVYAPLDSRRLYFQISDLRVKENSHEDTGRVE